MLNYADFVYFGVIILIESKEKTMNKKIIFLSVSSLLAAAFAVASGILLEANINSEDIFYDKKNEIQVNNTIDDFIEIDGGTANNIIFETAEVNEESINLDELEEQINSVIADNQAVSGGEWSVYISIPKTGDTLSINQKPMQAASVIKIFVMGAVYEQYDDLKEKYEYDDIDALIESMITVSDNEATDLLVTMLGNGDSVSGRAVVNDFCRQNGFENTSMDRMMTDDNIFSDNYTTTEDCAKMLEKIYLGEFSHSKEMIDFLRHQQRKNKIPAGIPNSVLVANKTGELEDVQNDVAIVFSRTPFILCIMSDGIYDFNAAETGVVNIADISYSYVRDNT